MQSTTAPRRSAAAVSNLFSRASRSARWWRAAAWRSSPSGSAVSATVESGGYLIVSFGGLASATNLASGGTLLVLPHGRASATSAAIGASVISSGVVLVSGYRGVRHQRRAVR